MNAADSRKNERSASRGLEGEGEAAEGEGGFDPRLWTPHLTPACNLVLCVCLLIRRGRVAGKKKKDSTGEQIDTVWTELTLVDQLENNLGFICSL